MAILLGATTQGCFWLLPLTQPTEVHYAETPDNWKLALQRYKPENLAPEKEPILLVHGIGMNHFTFDLAKERSLAIYLYERGYDVWMLELRDAGDSSHSSIFPGVTHKPTYNFDTMVEIDAPAAIEFVRFTTRQDQVSWVGHSLGAMLGYAYLGLHPDDTAIRTFVAISGPGNFKYKPKAMEFLLKLKQLATLQPKLYSRPLAQLLANNVGWLDNSFSPTKTFLAPQTTVESILWNNEAIDARTMSMVSYNTVSNLSRPLLQQVIGWLETGEFDSADGAVSYEQNLDRIHAPTMIMTGKVDALCPPMAARAVYEKIGTADKTYRIIGTANGATVDYGHLDILMGNEVRKDVFPQIHSWLETH